MKGRLPEEAGVLRSISDRRKIFLENAMKVERYLVTQYVSRTFSFSLNLFLLRNNIFLER
jgi:hypothetical protein